MRGFFSPGFIDVATMSAARAQTNASARVVAAFSYG